MLSKATRPASSDGRKGVGPLIPPLTESQRPLRQQVFELVRAAGLIPRVQLAKDLGVSPASVTTISSELIEAGLIEEVAAPRDNDAGRGRPAVALGVRAQAHRVAGMKLSDREHTAVIVDFAGKLIADDAIPRHPGPRSLPEILEAIETLLARVCAKAGVDRADLSPQSRSDAHRVRPDQSHVAGARFGRRRQTDPRRLCPPQGRRASRTPHHSGGAQRGSISTAERRRRVRPAAGDDPVRGPQEAVRRAPERHVGVERPVQPGSQGGLVLHASAPGRPGAGRVGRQPADVGAAQVAGMEARLFDVSPGRRLRQAAAGPRAAQRQRDRHLDRRPARGRRQGHLA